MTKTLNRTELSKRASKLPRTELHVPEWECDLTLQAMTGRDRDAYEVSITGNRANKDRRLNLVNVRARLIARCLIGPDGSLMFDYNNPADLDELGSYDARGLDRVFKACQELNGLTDEDVEKLTKNSSADAKDDFGTA